MPWIAQVGHVFRRNLADTWVSLTVVVTMVAVFAVRAVIGHRNGYLIEMLLDTGMRFAVVFHLALVVHRDPPPQPASFWATQPRTPSAVATAKVLHALLILAVVLMGTIVVQAAWQVDGEMQRSALALLTRYMAALLLSVLVFAALMPAVPRAAFGAAILPFTYSSLTDNQDRPGMSWPVLDAIFGFLEALPSAVFVSLSVILVGLFAWRYHRAELSKAMSWMFMLAALAPFALNMSTQPSSRDRSGTRLTTPPLAVTFEPRDDFVRLAFNAPRGLPGDLFRLVEWSVSGTHPDGTAYRLDGYEEVFGRQGREHPIVRLDGDVPRTIGDSTVALIDSATFRAFASTLGSDVRRSLRDIVSARVTGLIEAHEVREVERLPLRDGLAFLRDGRRVELTILPHDTSGPGISVRTSWLGDAVAVWPVPQGLRASHVSFALVNRIDGSMLPLRIADDTYHGPAALKLGFGVGAFDYELRPLTWTPSAPAVDSTWLASAELVVGAPVFTGSFTIDVEGRERIPRPEAGRRQDIGARTIP